jgi:hypothetical protein
MNAPESAAEMNKLHSLLIERLQIIHLAQVNE